jgi:L-asparaginase II
VSDTSVTSYDLDVVVTRGGAVESRHRVHAAVSDASGRLVGQSRDAAMVTWWRSCAKPFQVMPLVEGGGFDQLSWGDAELALACASHGGEPEHLAVAEAMLRDLGLEEGDLACGPHEPLSSRGAKLARDHGGRFTRLHNNCSGKHSAMLAAAHTNGWTTEGYEQAAHEVQQACTAAVAVWTGVPAASLLYGVDGCGVVVYGLPLDRMAHSYARLGAAAEKGQEVPSRILDALRANPFLVGGTDRFDTVLLDATDGRVFAKVGAEGVHTVTIPAAGLGFAVKAEDGAQRAQYVAVLRLLQHLGALSDPLPAKLAEWLVRPIRNTRGEIVGDVRPAS